MKCPSCITSDLKATRLDDGLPAHGCNDCGGAIIPLLYYRDWAERTANDKAPPDTELDASLAIESESHSALACPKCSRLMSKFNISGCSKNRLDLCSSCDEAWLDGGEWELLKALQLSKDIPSIFTDSWQRKVRKEISESKLKERFAKIVGDTDIEKAEEVRSWLNTHKNRAELIFYIGQE
jgi:Zn-finger nucleic acid-binding protein